MAKMNIPSNVLTGQASQEEMLEVLTKVKALMEQQVNPQPSLLTPAEAASAPVPVSPFAITHGSDPIVGATAQTNPFAALQPVQSIAQSMSEDDQKILMQMNTQSTVSLSAATELYAPVVGTSGGSRYFVCGMGPMLRVAARMMGNKASIRMEGPALQNPQVREVLEASGFSHLNEGYASIHVGIQNAMQFSKVTGACLFLVSAHLSTSIPRMDLIAAANGQ